MVDVSKKDRDKIKKDVEAEFPNDPALQEVHYARKLIAREAELEGLSFFEYIKKLEHEKRKQTIPVQVSWRYLDLIPDFEFPENPSTRLRIFDVNLQKLMGKESAI